MDLKLSKKKFLKQAGILLTALLIGTKGLAGTYTTKPDQQSIDMQFRRACEIFELKVNNQTVQIPPRWWVVPYEKRFETADHWLTPYRLSDGTDVDLMKPANPAPIRWSIISPDTGQSFTFEGDLYGGAGGIGPAKFKRIGNLEDFLELSWLAHFEQDPVDGYWNLIADTAPNGHKYSSIANTRVKGQVTIDKVVYKFDAKCSAMGSAIGGPEN
ncbi:hypothetical protein HYX19_00830 [Candidatus Woesearchaeota archaeon]|nr:hypothetical protein [Candidatus Woesearchaeota archaeon]